jgi:hypothetical protein
MTTKKKAKAPSADGYHGGKTDAEWTASLDNLHGIHALEAFQANELFAASSDPYYRDLTAALWKMFHRALDEIKEGRR